MTVGDGTVFMGRPEVSQYLLVMQQHGHEVQFRIDESGKFICEMSDGCTPDQAAQMFIEAVQRLVPDLKGS